MKASTLLRWSLVGAWTIAVGLCPLGSADACSPTPDWATAPEEPVYWVPIVVTGGLSKQRPDPRLYRVVSERPGPCGATQTHLHLGVPLLFLCGLAVLVGGARPIRVPRRSGPRDRRGVGR